MCTFQRRDLPLLPERICLHSELKIISLSLEGGGAGVPAPMSVLRFIIWGFLSCGTTSYMHRCNHLALITSPSKVVGLRNQCYTVIAVNNRGVTSYSESGVSANKGISQILHSF